MSGLPTPRHRSGSSRTGHAMQSGRQQARSCPPCCRRKRLGTAETSPSLSISPPRIARREQRSGGAVHGICVVEEGAAGGEKNAAGRLGVGANVDKPRRRHTGGASLVEKFPSFVVHEPPIGAGASPDELGHGDQPVIVGGAIGVIVDSGICGDGFLDLGEIKRSPVDQCNG
jgi:hypothetical protein